MHQLEPLRTGGRIDQDRCPGCQVLCARDQCGETAQAVARQLRGAAVCIEKLHSGAGRPKLVHDEPVATDAVMAMAQTPRQIGQVAAHVDCGDEEKVVPVGVRLCDS